MFVSVLIVFRFRLSGNYSSRPLVVVYHCNKTLQYKTVQSGNKTTQSLSRTIAYYNRVTVEEKQRVKRNDNAFIHSFIAQSVQKQQQQQQTNSMAGQ